MLCSVVDSRRLSSRCARLEAATEKRTRCVREGRRSTPALGQPQELQRPDAELRNGNTPALGQPQEQQRPDAELRNGQPQEQQRPDAELRNGNTRCATCRLW